MFRNQYSKLYLCSWNYHELQNTLNACLSVRFKHADSYSIFFIACLWNTGWIFLVIVFVRFSVPRLRSISIFFRYVIYLAWLLCKFYWFSWTILSALSDPERYLCRWSPRDLFPAPRTLRETCKWVPGKYLFPCIFCLRWKNLFPYNDVSLFFESGLWEEQMDAQSSPRLCWSNYQGD